MPFSTVFRLTTPRAIIVAGAIIAAAMWFSASDKVMAFAAVIGTVATICLVILTYFSARSARRIEWFTGAMERHSDQQRQLAAKRAGVDIIWWDPTEGNANKAFPFEGKHGEKFDLNAIYIGIPPEHRKVRASKWRTRLWGDH